MQLSCKPNSLLSVVDAQHVSTIGFADDVDSLTECGLAELNHVVDYSHSVALTDVSDAFTQLRISARRKIFDDSAVLDIPIHLDANRAIKSETTAHQS